MYRSTRILEDLRREHSFSIDPSRFSKCSLEEWDEICEATMNFLKSPNASYGNSLGWDPVLNVLVCDFNRIRRRFNVTVEYQFNGNDMHWIDKYEYWWKVVLDSVYSDNDRTKFKNIVDKYCSNYPNGCGIELQDMICPRMFSLMKIDTYYSNDVKDESMYFGHKIKDTIEKDYSHFVGLKQFAIEKIPSLKEHPDRMQYDGWKFVFPKRIRDWILEHFYELEDHEDRIMTWDRTSPGKFRDDENSENYPYFNIIDPIPQNINDLRLLMAANPNLKIIDPFDKT